MWKISDKANICSKLHGHNPATVGALVDKWGPCIRTALLVSRDPAHGDRRQQSRALAAARLLAAKPETTYEDGDCNLPTSKFSHILFMVPSRIVDPLGDPTDLAAVTYLVPTLHLSRILDAERQKVSVDNLLRLYDVSSMNGFPRQDDGWQVKKKMHVLMSREATVKIFSISRRSTIQTSDSLCPGTIREFVREARSGVSSFYWFPSRSNFYGIDGILVDHSNLYALQATIYDTHEPPNDGLEKIWQAIGADAGQTFTWHFVLVTDKQTLAEQYANSIEEQLSDFALGAENVHVSAWVSVLST